MTRSIIFCCLLPLAACVGDNFATAPPSLSNIAITTAEDTPRTVTVRVTALEPGAVTLTVVTPPAHGTLSGDGPSWTYTPDADYAGQDRLEVRGEDAHGSATASVTITITPVNDAPVANPDSLATGFDAPLTATQATLVANDTDVDSEELTVTAVEAAAGGHGAPALDGETVVFTPEAGFQGEASFLYTVSDGDESAQGTVTVSVGTDRPPVASDDAAATDEDTPVTIADKTLLANDSDPDGHTITVAAVGNPSHGTVAHEGGEVTFVPEPGYNGPAGFEYTVSDGMLTDVGAVVVTVGSVNDAPVVTASDGAASYAENASPVAVDADVAVVDSDSGSLAGATVRLTTGCTDPEDLLALTSPPGGISVAYDGPTCSLTLTGAATVASYQAALRAVTYVNDSEAPTTVARVVTFTVDDGEADGNTGSDTRDLTVVASDDSPVAVDDTATVAEDAVPSAIAVMANDTDVDDGARSVASVTQPADGTVAITGGGTGLTYTPDADDCNDPPGNDPDVFTYTLAPGGSVGTVSVTVTCADDAPVAVDDTASVDENSSDNSIDVLANDTDIDGGSKTVASVTQPVHGTAAVAGGGTAVLYTPASGYCNEAPNAPRDTFTYTLGGGSSATVAVDVVCVCGLNQATDFFVGID